MVANDNEKKKRRYRELPVGLSLEERIRDSQLWSRYGITLQQFREAFDAQGGKCACCGTTEPGSPKRGWCIDHRHTPQEDVAYNSRSAGKHGEVTIRGIVCFRCNIQIGVIEHANWPQLSAYLKRDKAA